MDSEDNTLELSFTVKAPDKCPCGSGRPPKRCCGLVKDRNYSIKMDRINYQFAHGLALDQSDMTVKRVINGKMLPIIGETTLTQSYDRPKGPKELITAKLHDLHSMDPNGIFLEYDHFFIIDTNTKNVGGGLISISAVMHAYADVSESGYHTLQYAPLTYLEFRNPLVPAEHLGWMALCGALEGNEEFSHKRVGVVVDSSKGSLNDFNSGRLPICNDYYLPRNFTLIYASADNGNSILNKLMKRCDKQAGNLLRWLLDNDHCEALQKPDYYPCSLFRQLEPSMDDPNWKIRHY